MTIERNVEGLRGNAQRKRQEAFDKVEQGIRQLLKEKQVINFNTVAKASGVSKAWLYKEPEIKARIEHLRENHSKAEKVPPKQRTSDASKDAIIKTLKERIKKIEAENRGLREQLEAVYGRILQASQIEHRLERLEAENARLKKELEICQEQSPKDSVTQKSDHLPLSTQKFQGEISDRVRNELSDLNIRLTSTLAYKIRSSTEEIVLTAIEALKEQMQHQIIKNPGGWLSSAINDAWQPNQSIGESNPAELFAQWYDLAREQGIVIGSRKDDDGVIWVQENTGQWVLFEEFSSRWTLQYLRSRIKN
ncbi:DUF6262 family protein [Calothrix sp. NIES-2098]|uniref:DUF6262 family protein n=1 Tax=Calothrix sp. NIES-2098 TaxID=1954171 RepID=UPI000B61AA2C|nr:hypothetical protein NIES2098_35790 [Calothrix sp. NIES-2098]